MRLWNKRHLVQLVLNTRIRSAPDTSFSHENHNSQKRTTSGLIGSDLSQSSPLFPGVERVSLDLDVTPSSTSCIESPSTSHNASGGEVTPVQKSERILEQCFGFLMTEKFKLN